MDSDRFDRLEALLSAKLDAQTQQVAELQKEVALLRTAVQANAGASTAPIMQQAAAQLAPPLRSSKSSKASSSDAFLSTALKRSFPMFVLPIKTLLSPSFQMFRPQSRRASRRGRAGRVAAGMGPVVFVLHRHLAGALPAPGQRPRLWTSSRPSPARSSGWSLASWR